MPSVAGESVTYEYDETAKAGIENVWCGHLKLDMKRQSAVCGGPKASVTDRVEMHEVSVITLL
jgi:hypothetical protein